MMMVAISPVASSQVAMATFAYDTNDGQDVAEGADDVSHGPLVVPSSVGMAQSRRMMILMFALVALVTM